MFKPAIKWIGVKGKQSNKIVSLFPKNFDSYYEPFCGSCAVLYELLKSSEHTILMDKILLTTMEPSDDSHTMI